MAEILVRCPYLIRCLKKRNSVAEQLFSGPDFCLLARMANPTAFLRRLLLCFVQYLKETPVVLIDADTLQCNLRRMASYRRTHNLALDPHTKTPAATIP